MDEGQSIREALQEHYAAHGLPPDGGAGRWYFVIRVGPLAIPAPNPGIRKRALLYHDAQHVVTGYNTRFSEGELEIARYEIGAGCGRFAFAWLVNLWMLAVGSVLLPRRVFAGFVRGGRCRSLYRWPGGASEAGEAGVGEPERLLGMTVGEIRAWAGVDAVGAAPAPGDRRQFAAWVAVAWLVTLGCGAAAAGLVVAVVFAVWRWWPGGLAGG